METGWEFGAPGRPNTGQPGSQTTQTNLDPRCLRCHIFWAFSTLASPISCSPPPFFCPPPSTLYPQPSVRPPPSLSSYLDTSLSILLHPLLPPPAAARKGRETSIAEDACKVSASLALLAWVLGARRESPSIFIRCVVCTSLLVAAAAAAAAAPALPHAQVRRKLGLGTRDPCSAPQFPCWVGWVGWLACQGGLGKPRGPFPSLLLHFPENPLFAADVHRTTKGVCPLLEAHCPSARPPTPSR